MSTTKNINDKLFKFLGRNHFIYIYPLIFILGVITDSLFDQDTLNSWRSSYFVSSKNRLNQLFAYDGNTIFTVLLIGINVSKVIQPVLDNSLSTDVSTHLLQNSVKVIPEVLLKFLIKIGSLIGLFQFIDYFFIQTGGSCVIKESVTNALANSSQNLEACSLYNGTWVNIQRGFCSITPLQFSTIIKSAEVCREYGEWRGGFDISGHFCFLVTVSLILWLELKNVSCSTEIGYENDLPDRDWFRISLLNLWRVLTFITLLIWIHLLIITSVFYHTTSEKLAGLVFGYATPLFIYLALPLVEYILGGFK